MPELPTTADIASLVAKGVDVVLLDKVAEGANTSRPNVRRGPAMRLSELNVR
jgi:hypothetical protein